MRRFGMALLVVLIVVVAAPQAEAQGNKYKAWISVAGIAPLGDENVDIQNSLETIELSSEVGAQIGFEWRSAWWGVALDLAGTDNEIDTDLDTVLADVEMMPLSLTGNFHLVHTRFLDFYFGPTISYVFWGDIEPVPGSPLMEPIKTDDTFGYGASVGLDVSLAKVIALTFGVRYTVLDLEASDGQKIAVNPLMATAGVTFRWGKRAK